MDYIARAAVVATTILVALLPSAVLRGVEPRALIHVEDAQIVLENDLGCRLVLHEDDGRYGLGTFFLGDVALGPPIKCFRTEDKVGNGTRDTFQRLWPGQWTPYFRPTRYEIIENGPDRGIIKLSGQEGKFAGSVTITLCHGQAGYRLDYSIAPGQSINHPVFASAPFWHDKMQFVQFPFENPLLPPFEGQWAIHPTRSTVPLMIACQAIEGKPYYVGMGYCLNDAYDRGRLQYDAISGSPLKAFFISPHDSGWLGGPSHDYKPQRYALSMVISTATTQYDCVSGYRAQSDYDMSTPVRRSLDESISGIMAMYKDCQSYVALPPYASKAYRQQVNPQTGEAVNKGYGLYVPIGVNVQLAYQLYQHWRKHPQDTWARERAINMANFFVETQDASGAVPTLWDTKERRFRAYHSLIDERGYVYATCQQAMGAQSLYRLYLARREAESESVEAWKTAAVRAMDDLLRKVQPDGFLGRNYDRQGECDTACAACWPLVALEYFAAQTGETKYDEVRDRLERWVYETFIRTNHWFGWSSDNGWWRSETPPPWNVDCLNAMTLATYCTQRHMRTGSAKYLEWAQQIVAYNWLATIPIQFPGFQHVTKGLVREQEFYLTYDLPFRTCLYVDCLPYLSSVTGDRFFFDYYKAMIQTQMAYQNRSPRMQSFNIGLWWDASGANPADELGEPNVNYIVEFCSLFLESVTSPNAYRYVGGSDWGIGLDYDLGFTPQFNNAGPYVVRCTSRLGDARWDAQTRILQASLSGQPGDAGQLVVGWQPSLYPASDIRTLIDGEPAPDECCHATRLGDRDALAVDFTLPCDSLTIRVEFPPEKAR